MKLSEFQLAFREFTHSFSFRKKSAPGSKDFMWLSGLLGLIVSLGVVFSGARDGLIENFSDSLLGKIAGVGVPLWVTSHPENAINKGISRKVEQLFLESKSQTLDDQLELDELALFPYVFLEHSDPIVRLPDDDIWQKASTSDKQDFEGWAVSSHDPLRQWSSKHSTNEEQRLTVFINKNLFSSRFDMQTYRSSLKGLIPLEAIPDSEMTSNELSNIWLLIWVQDRFELVNFDITWVNSFPALQKLVYLFPLEIYQASILSRRTPFRFAPEGQGKETMRIASIDVLDIDLAPTETLVNEEGKEKLSLFSVCLDTDIEYQDDSVAELTQFAVPRSLNRVEACLSVANFPNEIEIDKQMTTSASYEYTPDHFLILPCSELKSCTENENGETDWQHPTSIDMYEFFSGANVYVQNRTELAAAKDVLLDLRLEGNQVFYFNPVYQDAILRFSYLTRTLDWIQIPLIFVYLVFVISLLWVKLSTLLNHRLNNYGVMLAKGMYWYQVKRVLYIQIITSTLVGAIVIGGSVELLGKFLFNQAFTFSSVADLGRMSLGIQDFTLMPVNSVAYFQITLITLLLALAVLELLLQRMPMNKNTNPMDLI